jgi:hypothetical protein
LTYFYFNLICVRTTGEPAAKRRTLAAAAIPKKAYGNRINPSQPRLVPASPCQSFSQPRVLSFFDHNKRLKEAKGVDWGDDEDGGDDEPI